MPKPDQEQLLISQLDCRIFNHIDKVSLPSYMKVHQFSYTLNDYFTHIGFCDFIHLSFGKQITDLCSSSKGWHIPFYIIKKAQSLTSSPISSGMCLKYQEMPKFMMDTNFPKFLFSFDSSNFMTITVFCFSQSARFILFIFKDIPAQYSSLKDHSLSVNYYSNKDNVPQ